MSVYYIHSPDTALVKIGFAANPLGRLGKMQVDSPTRLVLLAVEDGGKEAEAARHRRFASLRKRGEWFAFEGDLKAFIGELPPFVQPERVRFVTDIAERAGISKSYASQMLSGQRASIEVILHVFTATGWKHPSLDGIDEETLRLLALRFPFRKAA
jgi:transcriptional regulator with XRE-family HTH domain